MSKSTAGALFAVMKRAALVLAMVTACGGGDDTLPPPDITIPPTVAVTSPASIAPTDPWSIDVAITGDPAGAALEIIVRPPAAATVTDEARYVQAGIEPAVGAPQWLAVDGTWSATEVAYQATAATGTQTIALTLPDARAGEWRVIAVVQAADGPVTAATARVIAASQPALRVSIDRAWVNVLDPVAATAQVVTAGQPDLQLVGWLTVPDGRVLALPEISPTYRVVPRVVEDQTVTLLNTDLLAFGPGDYRVAARLVDADGNLLAAGGGGFTVCDTDGSIDGTIVDDQGAAIAVDGDADLVLRSINDVPRTLRVPVGADGTFHGSVPVGQWFVAGPLVDASGSRTLELASVEVGCAGPTAFTVTTGVKTMTGARDLGPIVPPPPAGTTAERGFGQPPIKISALYKFRGAFAENIAAGDNVSNKIAIALESQAEIVDHLTISAITRHVTLLQQLDGDAEAETEAIGNLIGRFDALEEIEFGTVGRRFTLRVSIVAPTGILLARQEISTRDGEDAGKLLSDYAPILVQRLAYEASGKLYPATGEMKNPVMSIDVTPEDPVEGSSVTATVHVKDRDTCIPAQQGTTIDLAYDLGAGMRGNRGVSLDASGTGRFTTTAPIGGRRAIFTPSFTDPKQGLITALPAMAYYRALSNIELALDKVKALPGSIVRATLRAVAPGQTLPVAPVVPPDLTPAAFTDFTIVVGSGTAPDHVTTDAQGKATFDWTVGAGGLAVANAVATIGHDDAGVMVEPNHQLAVSAFPNDTVLTDVPIDIDAVVTLTNGLPAIGAAVRMSGGAVAATDADGRATLPYRTPLIPGSYPLMVTATFDGVPVTKTITITARAPCAPNCPPVVVTTDDPDHAVAKGGTIRFFANQDVTWFATGGTIASDGTVTAAAQGGVWTVTAVSTENPGATGTLDYVIDCDDVELIGDYAGMQTIEVLDASYSCADGAGATGEVHILDHPFPDTSNYVDVLYDIIPGSPPACEQIYGVGELNFPPRIDHCTITQYVHTQPTGCLYTSISISAKGPGVAGITGHTAYGVEVAGSCVDVDDEDFDMNRVP